MTTTNQKRTTSDATEIGDDLRITKTTAPDFRRRDLGDRNDRRAPLRRPGLPRTRRHAPTTNWATAASRSSGSSDKRTSTGLERRPMAGDHRFPTAAGDEYRHGLRRQRR